MNVPFSEQHFYDSVIKLEKWCVYTYNCVSRTVLCILCLHFIFERKLNENEVATWVSLILGFDLIQLIYDYILIINITFYCHFTVVQ